MICDDDDPKPQRSSDPGPRVATLEEIVAMARCAHENRAGGNDYILCNDCHLMWDYRKESANDGLVNFIKGQV